MRTEVVFKTRRKPITGEILEQDETSIDLRYIDRDGKYRCIKIERETIRELRPLLIDVPRQ